METVRTHTLRRGGFSLIELVVVMTLLVILMAVTIPSLSRFFGGRSLTEEARRLLSLTRYARNEAVSRAEPMEVWIEPDTGAYGVEPQAERTGTRDRFETQEKEWPAFVLDDGIVFDVGQVEFDRDNRVRILFLPDGAIDEESLEVLALVNEREDEVGIVREASGIRYVLLTAEVEQALDQKRTTGDRRTRTR